MDALAPLRTAFPENAARIYPQKNITNFSASVLRLVSYSNPFLIGEISGKVVDEKFSFLPGVWEDGVWWNGIPLAGWVVRSLDADWVKQRVG